MSWHLRSVRFTFFLMPGVAAPSDLWKAVLDSEPENVIEKRGIGLRQEQGRINDVAIVVSSQPGRIDCLFNPVETPDPEPAVLGAYPKALNEPIDRIRRWMQGGGAPAIRRIALGTTLFERVDNRESGHKRLHDFIDAAPSGGDVSDFLYQINRFRPSSTGISGLNVNRLSKWSVSEFQVVTLDSAGSIGKSPTSPSYVTLELDVNTSADYLGPLPTDRLSDVLADLLAGVDEVASKGERGL